MKSRRCVCICADLVLSVRQRVGKLIWNFQFICFNMGYDRKIFYISCLDKLLDIQLSAKQILLNDRIQLQNIGEHVRKPMAKNFERGLTDEVLLGLF